MVSQLAVGAESGSVVYSQGVYPEYLPSTHAGGSANSRSVRGLEFVSIGDECSSQQFGFCSSTFVRLSKEGELAKFAYDLTVCGQIQHIRLCFLSFGLFDHPHPIQGKENYQ